MRNGVTAVQFCHLSLLTAKYGRCKLQSPFVTSQGRAEPVLTPEARTFQGVRISYHQLLSGAMKMNSIATESNILVDLILPLYCKMLYILLQDSSSLTLASIRLSMLPLHLLCHFRKLLRLLLQQLSGTPQPRKCVSPTQYR